MPEMLLGQAVRDAIHAERSAARFYRGLVGKAPEGETRQLLDRLSAEEDRHARQLEQLASELVEGERVCRLESAPEWIVVDEITLREALEIAIRTEMHTAQHYGDIAETVGEGPVFDLFATLRYVEQEHARRLDQLLLPR